MSVYLHLKLPIYMLYIQATGHWIVPGSDDAACGLLHLSVVCVRVI